MYGRPLERLCDDDVGSLPFFWRLRIEFETCGLRNRRVVSRVQGERLRDLD